MFGLSHRTKGLSRFAVLAALAIAALALPASAAATGKGSGHGHGHGHGHGSTHGKKRAVGVLYTETNDPMNNQVVAFNRHADGSLTQGQVISTGGTGGQQAQPGCVPTCPILDTQGELALAAGGHLLFAVNAGSGTVSSFRITNHRLTLADQQSTGVAGSFPNSLTTNGHLLYVLNSNTRTITGFRFSSKGKLTPISGSTRSLTTATSDLPGAPRQIGFDNNGKVLVVTLLSSAPLTPADGTSSIDTFVVNKHTGAPGSATADNATTPYPFGFAFDPRNQLVMSQVTSLTVPGKGDAQTYSVTRSGNVTAIGGSPAATNGTAPCWVAITNSGRFAYVVNTGGGAPTGSTVTAFKLSPHGRLTQIQVTSDALSSQFAKTDETLSSDGRYLYVLAPGLMPGGQSNIDEYKVANNGHLSLMGDVVSPGLGDSGLVGQ